ncbi:MAG: serine hydrolase [Candidatus Aminicenantes bacterium]|jgi:CubicO group peptidase (beta-lactamase class C family)/tetratricopeptide (TPR) repeat protein
MKRHHLFFLLIILAVIWGSANAAQNEASHPYAQAIRKYRDFLNLHMMWDKVPGLSVGFLKDGVVWVEGFGYSDLENSVPAKPESAYRLASITKTITAMAILQLVEKGKIDLDDEVQRYVPYFPKKKWPITIRQLLGHIGGVSHYNNYEIEGHIKTHKDTREAIAIFQDFPLVAEPGTRYNYSTYGYNLLGAVIESASGQSYGSYIKQHIFDPLGMSNSRLDDPVDIIPNRVRGYRQVQGQIKNSEYIDISSRFAGGGTRSTVVDLLKYAIGILDRKLLQTETYRKMFTPMILKNGKYTTYGMGWNVRPMNGHFRIHHGGSQAETKTFLLIFPTERFAVAVASNLESFDRMFYVNRLAELVLGEDLDLEVYIAGKSEKVVYDTCRKVFSYGLSRNDWNEKHTAQNNRGLAESFSYFFQNVNVSALSRNFLSTKTKIEDGFHPLGKEAMIKVGSFMASALEADRGKEKLRTYHKSGPLDFFYDYIKLSNEWPSSQHAYQFTETFFDQISSWKKEWNTVYTDELRNISISPQTDIDHLSSHLRKAFSHKKIYPDFSDAMARVSRHHLRENDQTKAFDLLDLSVALYPDTPAPLTHLGEAYIWIGDLRSATKLYKRAMDLEPDHSDLRLRHFYDLGGKLIEAGKDLRVFTALGVAEALFPTNAKLLSDLGDLYAQVGDRDKAISYYKKALEIVPKDKDIQNKLDRLRRR